MKPDDALADPTQFVFIQRPHCPACGSADLQTIRSKDVGDGIVERRTQCRSCFHKFRVVVE
jgi:transcriptional regulator NrdR family protein